MDAAQRLPPDEGNVGEAQKQVGVHMPDTAARVLSPLNLDHGYSVTPDFTARKRSLAQIYETIQRYLMGMARRSESYYPSTDDVFEDLQVYKRTISDRVPMPSREVLEDELLLLAVQSPPFIQVLRELECDPTGRLSVVTRYSAPTEKHQDKVQVSFQAVVRNSAEAFKLFVAQNRKQFPWEMELVRGQAAEEPDLRPGRVDRLLRMLFVTPTRSLSAESAAGLKRVNHDIQRRIILPCLQQLLRDQTIISLSCKELRVSSIPGAERFTDLIFPSDDEALERRFRIVCGMLESPRIRGLLDSSLLADIEQQRAELGDHRYFARIGRALLDRAVADGAANPIPAGVLDAAVEAMKLGDRRHESEEARRREDEVDAVRSILERLEKQGSVYRARHGDKVLVPDRYLRLALADRLPGVLACTEPFLDLRGRALPPSLSVFTSVYLLLRDRRVVAQAIDSALEVFEKSGDSFLLHILENVLGLGVRNDREMKEFVPPLHLEKLRAALKRAYARDLPWWQRMWMLLSSAEMSDGRMTALRDQRRTEASRRIQTVAVREEKAATASAQKEIRRVARERVEAQTREAQAPTASEEDRQALSGIRDVLRACWEKTEPPTREEVLARMKADWRDAARRVLELAVVGAASVRPVVSIKPDHGEPFFADDSYLREHRERLVGTLTKRLQGEEEITIDNVTMTRRREVRNQDALAAALRHIRGLS